MEGKQEKSRAETATFFVNGEEQPWQRELTVAGLVEERLGRHPATVAVELNREILPRARYAATTLAPGDRVEIVHFVQGG